MIIGKFRDFTILYEIMEDYSAPPFVEGFFVIVLIDTMSQIKLK